MSYLPDVDWVEEYCKLLNFASTTYVATPALTTDGVQWSDSKDTTTANTDITVFQVAISPPRAGTLKEVEFGLMAGFRAVASATADLIYQWQAKDNAVSTWVNMFAATTITNPGTTEQEKPWSGVFPPLYSANFDAVPFDIRLILQCNEANEGRGRVKGSSWVRFKYAPS